MSDDTTRISGVHVDDEFLELKHVEQELLKGCDGFSFSVCSLRSLKEFNDYLNGGERPDAVILDVHFVDEKEKGIEFAAKTKTRWPSTAVLVRTSDYNCVQSALRAGAEDFIGKENFEGEIGMRTVRAVQSVRERHKKGVGANDRTSKTVGETMQAIENRASRIVSSSIKAVHIRGESGTGKEVVTDLIEAVAGKPFIKVNCAAIQENIFDSELFGYIKGAFTGAIKDTPGLIEAADNGWMFLDEVATIPLSCQAKLLRVLDNNEFKRVGDNKTRKANIRVLSATNEDLEEMVEQRQFRNDLLQRLKETEIFLPPLRERPNEVRKLVEHFCQTLDGGPYKITEPTIKILCGYNWSEGNVRELRNCLRAMTEHQLNKLLTPMAVPEKILEWSDVKDVEDSSTTNDFQSNELTVKWVGKEIPSHNALSDSLFLEMVRLVNREKGTLPLGEIASIVGYSNRIVSEKLKNLVSNGTITTEELLDITKLKVNTDGDK